MILHEVITTEKVPFRYRVAGLGSRFLAWLIDAVFWILLVFMGAMIMVVLEGGREGVGSAVFFFWIFVLRWGYFLFFEWLWQGQTPGKRLVGLRVIRLDGTSVGFQPAVVRNLVRIVDALPFFYALAFLVAAGNRERRRLGDLAAGTLVVFVERGAKLIRALTEGKSEADRVRLALWRQKLGLLDRAQKQTLLELCLRRDQLRPAERARLFQSTAGFIRERLGLEPEEFESEEKFILQLAAILGERGLPEGSEGKQARKEKARG